MTQVTQELRPTERNAGTAPEERRSDSIGGISLVLIVLDDNPLLEQGGVLSVVLVAVVGVDGMRHVSADQEAILDGALYGSLLTLRQNAGYSMNGVLHNRPSSSCKAHVESQGYHRGVRGARGVEGRSKAKVACLQDRFMRQLGSGGRRGGGGESGLMA